MIKLKHILTEQATSDKQAFHDKYLRRGGEDGNYESYYDRMEDSTRGDAVKAQEAAWTLTWLSRMWYVPKAVLQAAIQSIDNNNVLQQVESTLGTDDLETWFFDHDFGFSTYTNWHRGSTIADKFEDFEKWDQTPIGIAAADAAKRALKNKLASK